MNIYWSNKARFTYRYKLFIKAGYKFLSGNSFVLPIAIGTLRLDELMPHPSNSNFYFFNSEYFAVYWNLNN